MNPTLFQSLPVVAHAIGHQCGIRVEIGGERAYTDGHILHLPYPKDFDRDVLLGFLVHEAGHIRFSDFKTLRKNDRPVIRHLQNIYEDTRIERLICGVYLGANALLRQTVRHVFSAAYTVTEKTTPLVLLMDFIAFDVWDRYRLTGGLLASHAKTTRRLVDALFPEALISALVAVNDQIVTAQSSRATRAMAQAAYRLMAEYLQKYPSAFKSTLDAKTRATQKPSSTAPEACQSAPSPAEASASSECPSQALASDTDGSSSSVKPDQSQAAIAALDAFTDDTKDMGQALAKGIEVSVATQGAGETPASHGAICVKARPEEDQSAEAFLRRCRLVSNGLKRQLAGLVAQAARTQTRTLASGRKIAGGKLARLASGNTRVFQKRVMHESTASAVHILLDMSGSMRKRATVAAQAATGLWMALSALPKTNPALSIFPATNGQDACEVIVGHGETLTVGVKGRFDRFLAAGGTPLAEALTDVVGLLALTRERRKIVIVVTDGAPADPYAAKRYLDEMVASGIEVYGIGIGYDVAHLFDRCVTIETIEALSAVLFDLAKRTALAGVTVSSSH